MSDTDTISPTPPAADPALLPFEETLAAAFPALDASEEDVAHLADVPPDSRLLAATPPPLLLDVQELEDEVAHTRVIFVRGAAAIPLTALLAIAGSILFHAAIAASFILAIFFSIRLNQGNGPPRIADDPGGSGAGYMVASPAPDAAPQHTPDLDTLLSHATIPPIPSLPLPASPSDAATPNQLAAAELASPPIDLGVIGIPSADQRLGHVKPSPPPRPPQPIPPDPQTLIVAPPLPDARPDPRPANVQLASTASPHPASPRHASGDDDSDSGNERPIYLTKADAAGGGGGHGAGDGDDRGGSGANNPKPTLLDWPALPAERTTRQTHDIICRVTVGADGHPVKAEIIQSGGDPALDELWRYGLLHDAKYRPAYRAGKPYAASDDYVSVAPK